MKFLLSGIAILAVGLGIMFWVINCGDARNPGGKKGDSDDPPPEFADVEDQSGQFGSDRPALADGDAKPVPFDGKRAMTYLETICKIGPRISGSASMRKQQEIIKKHFEDLGAKVTFQNFEAKQNNVRGKTPMANIIVSFQPDKKRRVILCSHYDTRPIADQEKDPRDWKKPFVSANDGGSGVALLMEMGNHMKDLKTNVGVDFVFFDGEEFVTVTKGGNKDRYFIGSEYFALAWKSQNKKDRCDYSAAILLDMVAGKDIRFPFDTYSYRYYSDLCEQVWGIAREQKVPAFVRERSQYTVEDDHLSLQKVGIPAIDIIDFEFPHWHKLTDTPENCSADSMEQVAKVLSVWLQRTK